MKNLIKFTCLLLFNYSYSYSQIEITLRKTFVDSVKDKVTISAEYIIDKAKPHVNSQKDDGDIHFAGRDKQIGLPIVAEVMNARDENNALQLIHDKEGTNEKVPLIGTWRIWCEHPGSQAEEFKQGSHLDKFTTTNPNHVFEIHPVTHIGDIDVANSFKDIEGFTYKDPEKAFEAYANTAFKIKNKTKTVTLVTKGVGYNYVKFKIAILDEHPFETDDGAFVFCDVLNDDGEIICNKVRMAFAKGTEPFNKIMQMHQGDELEVVGLPRICLKLVSWRIQHAVQNPDVLNWGLPVEMIIVAVLNG